MPTYFKLLRRKIGILTLMVACVLMAAWIRSRNQFDMIDIPHKTSNGTMSNSVLISTCGKFAIAVCTKFNVIVMRTSPPIEIRLCPSLTTHHATKDRFFVKSMVANTVGIYEDVNIHQESTSMIPYWSIVIPLTLLSAWLLLSKPRAGKSKSDSLC